MKKTSIIIAIFSVVSILKYKVAEAVCPLCTIAVAGGVGFSRWIGIDDTISGLWIGALTLSMALWNINWFDKKKIHFKFHMLLCHCCPFIVEYGNYWKSIRSA